VAGLSATNANRRGSEKGKKRGKGSRGESKRMTKISADKTSSDDLDREWRGELKCDVEEEKRTPNPSKG